nr:XRE family transcriptional regulator [Kibdelosporangium sp. MJ126-NF4]
MRWLKLQGKPISQDTLGRWLGLNQGQISKLEKGSPEYNILALREYAEKLRLPRHMLWFLFPGEGRIEVSESAPGFAATPKGSLVPASTISPSIAELCGVLADYGFSTLRFSSHQLDSIPSIDVLERDLRIAFDAYQQSRFTAAATRISTLLADVQIAARECRDSERVRVFRVLALSYQAAASVLIKVGQRDMAWIAAERGMNAAESADSPAIRGSLIRSVAFALVSTSRLEAAMRLVESGAEYLENEISDDNAALSVYGTLYLVGSMAAARFGDRSKTVDYLNEANTAARRLDKDANHLWTAFGPTNVAIHRVNTAAELGDVQTILNSPLTLNPQAVPVERQVRYLLDVARAHSLVGNRDDALGVMMTVERMAPEQVRQHHLSKKVVATLIQSGAGKPSIELDKLAQRVNARGEI